MCMWTETTRSLTFSLAFAAAFLLVCCCWWCECASQAPTPAVPESPQQRHRRSILAAGPPTAAAAVLPDVTKFNVSQTEYTRMMTIYLERLEATNPTSKTVLKLFNYEHTERRDRLVRRRISQKNFYEAATRLHFPVNGSRLRSDTEVESATLRLLSPALPPTSDADTQAPIAVEVQVFQVLGGRRRRLLDRRQVYLSPRAPKWVEFDVTRGLRAWLAGERNLGLELRCPECFRRNGTLVAPRLAPTPAISALLYVSNGADEVLRNRRAAVNEQPAYSKNRRTECGARNGASKPRCCRHKMQITFKDIEGMENIIQPKTFDAGYCQGRCPFNYNLAHNHAKIQSLMWRRNHTLPRLCCAPSTLAGLEVLTIDNHDPTKLNVQKWDNMSVLECSCS